MVSWKSFKFNIDKCNFITVSKSKEEIQVGETSLTIVNRVKLLGIHNDGRLNFDYHVSQLCKGNLKLNWIWNLHWGYFLINEVGLWFYQLDLVTFSKNAFWSVNCTLFFYQFIAPKCELYNLWKKGWHI